MRILHTADWQLGLRLNFVGGETAARLRAQRFDTVRRIADLAREKQVDAVLVAGDVFDDNGIGGETLQQARDALESFGQVPVVLLPGNHDPATADSALRRLGSLPPTIHVALTREPVSLAGLTVFPCPLLSRHDFDDPASWLPQQTDAQSIRIVLAHGGALSFGETTEAPNRIDVDAILARGYDYVALGDWHGLFEVNPRAWYSGAHEATRFKEKRPGHVLLIDIEAAGAAPKIEALTIARTRWLTREIDLLNDEDLEPFAAWLDGLDEKSWTLADIKVKGQLSLAGHARLEAIIADYGDRLALLRIDTSTVQIEPTADDIGILRGEGYLGRAIEVLQNGDTREDADALRLLYRLMQEPAG